MYRRRRSGVPNLLLLILLGVFGGIVFLVYDNANNAAPVVITEPIEVTPVSTDAPVLDDAVPTPRPTAVTGIISQSELFIPSAGVTAPIIPVFLDGESWNVKQLGRNIGHLQGTTDLDATGNIVLSGHVEMSDGRRGIFADLNQIVVGDRVILRHENTERLYHVIELKQVSPDDLTPLYPSDEDRITLITCDEYDFFQDTYHKRIVVVAERVG